MRWRARKGLDALQDPVDAEQELYLLPGAG
jgi:hypothetical protein